MYDIYSDITTKTNYSAEQLRAAAAKIRPDNGFADAFDAIAAAEKKYGINSLFMLAHAAVESAWGTSYFASARNNLFGFNAYDSNPDMASMYNSKSASVEFYAKFLAENYLKQGAPYYNGVTPHGVFVKYSSSHDSEAFTVVKIMNNLEAHIKGDDSAPADATAVSSAPSDSEYDVQPGDALWSIAKGDNALIDRIIQANKARYPSIGTGIDAHIEAGWRILIPTKENTQGTASGNVYITVPAGKDGFLGTLAANYGTSVKQIVEWNKEKYPSIGDKVGKTPSFVAAGWVIRVK